MAKVFFVSNVFSTEEEEEKRRQRKLMKEYWSDKARDELRNLGFDPDKDFDFTALSRNSELGSPGFKTKFYDITPKGSAITAALSSIKNEYEDYLHHYFVYFDGDGQIPFDIPFSILKQLKKEKEKFVIGCRSGRPGIHPERYLIEKFELFLIEHKFGVYLRDGQCGCWGFQTEVLKKYFPTGKGFDIELDVLSNFLRHHIYPSYVYTPVKYKEDTTFKAKDHEKKLYYLIERLEWTREYILSLSKKFSKKYNNLPKKYRQLLKNIDWPIVNHIEKNQQTRLFKNNIVIPLCNCGNCKIECECGKKIRTIQS